MLQKVAQFQIGKLGVNPGVIESLKTVLKNHKQVRISVLKSASRDRNKLKEMVKEIEDKLEIPFDYKIIGFTIILRRRLLKLKK